MWSKLPLSKSRQCASFVFTHSAPLGEKRLIKIKIRIKISTTFTCEELRVTDGKPSSNAGHKKNKSNESAKRSKERLFRYQEGKLKDIEIKKKTGEKIMLLSGRKLNLQSSHR